MDFWLESGAEVLGHVSGMYDAEIGYVDAQISWLLGRVRSEGLHTNLLVVVASDHGDELLEHGGYSMGIRSARSSPGALWSRRGPGTSQEALFSTILWRT